MSFVIVSRLHSDAPAKWKAQWKRLLLAAPHESSQLLKQLATKSGMPLLRRAEGGIGGDNNKQLRFERAPPYLDFGDLRAALVNLRQTLGPFKKLKICEIWCRPALTII
jgi:hypothetical protein